jgi:hypothetical protein
VRGVIAPVLPYCDDCNASGLYMSEHDPAERLAQYGGDHILLNSIALLRQQAKSLFPASDNKKNTRQKWFTCQFGDRCWELDADPNDLRAWQGGVRAGIPLHHLVKSKRNLSH